MKVKLNATKLENADVTHISLVERGANRAPFKIIKSQESKMIDLSKVFLKKAEGPTEVQVLGYIMQKQDNTEEVRTALKAAGVDVESIEEFEDGVALFKQGDVVIKEDEVYPVKLQEGFIALCKGFDPTQVAGQSQSFGEVIKSQGFMPGFNLATEALYNTIKNSMRESKTKDEAVAALNTALTDYQNYMLTIAKGIPLSAFGACEAFNTAVETAKAEATKKADEVAKASKVCKECGGPVDDNGKHMSGGKSTEPDEDDKAKKAEADAVKKAEDEKAAKELALKNAKDAAAAETDPTKKAELEAKVKELEPEPAKAPDVSAQINEAVGSVAKSLSEAMGKAISDMSATLTKSITDLGTKVDAVAKDAADAKTLAEKHDKTMKGTVTGGDPDDDPVNPGKVVNKDEGGMGCIDTSIHRNVRKSASYADTVARKHARSGL